MGYRNKAQSQWDMDDWTDYMADEKAKVVGPHKQALLPFSDSASTSASVTLFDPHMKKSKNFKKGGTYKNGTVKEVSYTKCAHSHPALQMPNSDLKIYGGYAGGPVVADADVYIGFDHCMTHTQRAWPWKKGTEFLFPIPDMGIPKQPEEFRKLVKWVKKEMEDGKKVHVGCIGGHGRTGMFLAALVSEFGEKDASNYVRKHYCKKAVESTAQVDFLFNEYGITKVQGYKSGLGAWSSKSSGSAKGGGHRSYEPMRGKGAIWGDKVPECN